MKKVDTIGMERIESNAGTRRVKRRHSPEFKARVIAACEARGASVAGVALAHGVNANLVRKWIIKKSRALVPTGTLSLLPVRIMSGAASKVTTSKRSASVRHGEAIEIDLAGARIRVRAEFDTDTLRDVVRVLRDTLMR
jgi:transposase